MNGYDAIKQVPYSLEAEQAVLGAVLVDSERFSDVVQILQSSDFYIDQHIAIYEVMQELFADNKRIDYVTVIDRLEKNGVYTKEEGMQYVKRLADSFPSISNVEEYARIIHDKSLLRKLIKASNEIAESAYAATDDASETVDAAEQKIFEIAQDKIRGDFSHIREIIVTSLSALQSIIDNPDSSIGVKTRFSSLDRLIVGMGEGDLIIIGARPGMGKTSFALNIASNVAQASDKAVAIFSLEMSSQQLVMRLISSVAMIHNHNLRTGKLSDEEWLKISKVGSALSKCNIYIDDSSGSNPMTMKAKLRRVKNLGLVIVDYLQLMRSDKHFESNVLEVGDITRKLKLMAKDLKVPIICVSQLSRATEKRQNSQPVLSDLRDSGSIEQDADIVLFLNRDYNKEKPDSDNAADLIVAKNRHGETGKISLGWYGQYFRFIEGTDRYDGQEPPRAGTGYIDE